MKSVKFDGRKVGDGAPCFVIAEAGSNHNGKLPMAFRLIDVAARAGADAVKFQTFRADRMYTHRAGTSDYLKLEKSIYDVIHDMEMPYEWIPRLAEHCRRRKIMFVSTPFDEESADRLRPYVDFFKIASYELNHHPLLRHIARFRKPVVMSTGAATEQEVEESFKVLRSAGAKAICLMQCTAAYPAPLDSINVRVLRTFQDRFQVPAGVSDHSREPLVVPLAAAALGADLLEKHFTLRNDLPGPDHRFAVTPPELVELVRGVRQVEQARGDGRKQVHDVEKELRHFARRSLFASRDLLKGTSLTREDVAILRNGRMPEGLPPSQLESVLGATLRRALRKGQPITRGSVSR